MRILAGYDGTVPADGALYDLEGAGLPDEAEALVLAASPPWAPPLRDARELAERGARYLRDRFPGWEIRSEAVLDDPAHALLEKAETWRADLIALGTPDRSTLSRLFRGSVTRKILHHARTGVRISRPRLAGRRDIGCLGRRPVGRGSVILAVVTHRRGPVGHRRPRPPLLHFTHNAAYGSALRRSFGMLVPQFSHWP